MKKLLKAALPHIIALAIFYLLVCTFFATGLIKGKELQRGDSVSAVAMGQELREYYEKDGGTSAWTGSMFSGMPSYNIALYGAPKDFVNFLVQPFKAMDADVTGPILLALIFFYILMCVMGVKSWLAIAGAIAFAFASYNIILIQAGHSSKMYTMALMPLIVSGFWLLFKKEKLIWGFIVSLLGIYLSLASNHMQITYYTVIMCVFLFIGFSVKFFKERKFKQWGKIVGLLSLAVILVVVRMSGHLYSQYESAQTSLRGPSELTAAVTEDGLQSSGLDINYAFSWSYGRGELLTLIIPKAYGGASGEFVEKGDEFYDTYKQMGGNPGKTLAAPTYWGDQPFTSGPVYFGAVVCFLFILGMFVIKSKMKWWVFGLSVLCILMSLGSHFMWFNEWLFYHLPMYSKFRTPSMILVIPGFTFVWIGFWGLRDIFFGGAKIVLGTKTASLKEQGTKTVSDAKLWRGLWWSLGITGGICLLVALFPSIVGSFTSAGDAQYSQWPSQLMDSLVATRKSMASGDALRSILFILLAAATIFYFIKAKNKKTATTITSIAILVLVTIDLWPIAKDYLNENHYISKKEYAANTYKKTVADDFILRDENQSYRVLNLARNTFNESLTSYYHKSIGGYSPAKLRRYQELIDHNIAKEIQYIGERFNAQNFASFDEVFANTPTLNMLNLKYLIYNNDAAPIINTQGFGNAWFVDSLFSAENADAEIAALDNINPHTTAVYDKKFSDVVDKIPATALQLPHSATDSISLLKYTPNKLTYISNTSTDRVAVFSEIYYPHDWHVTIDGQSAEHFRADWTFRAMNIPAGEHTIVFEFYPKTLMGLYSMGSWLSLIILLGFLGWTCFSLYRFCKE